jgi:hypothetical protein
VITEGIASMATLLRPMQMQEPLLFRQTRILLTSLVSKSGTSYYYVQDKSQTNTTKRTQSGGSALAVGDETR